MAETTGHGEGGRAMRGTFIDFFAGIGGFTAGLTQAGFKCVGFCEKDKHAIRSYRAIHNPDGKEWFSDDITTLEANDIPYAEGWTAGFPCQDISISGKHRSGLAGQRSGLFFEIIRLIKGKDPEGKPRWVCLENVKNLLSIHGGRDYTEVLYQLSEAGYDCEWQLINSKSYVPQNRERVFVIGHLRDGCPRKVFPVGTANTKTLVGLIGGTQGWRVYAPCGIGAALTAQGGGGGARTGLYCVGINRKEGVTKEIGCAYALTASDTRGLNRNQTQNAVIDCTGQGPSLMGLGKGGNSGAYVCARAVLTPNRANKRQNGRRFKGCGEPSFTLTCQDRMGVLLCGPGTGFGRIRRLTPLECFRLQGFSDGMFYRVRAANSDNQLYKQAGNGVTVPAIYDIGRKLWEVYHGAV